MGIEHITTGIRRLHDWRHFLDILDGAPNQVRTKLLTHYGHDSVSILLADIPHANNVSAEAARITIRRITGAPALGHRQLGRTSTCPVCDTKGTRPGIHGTTRGPLPRGRSQSLYARGINHVLT